MLLRFIKDPLFLFLLLGAGVFLIYHLLNRRDLYNNQSTVVITDADVDRLTELYRMTWQTDPDSSALTNILKDHVTGEILYKEALKMGLDHNDEIIKRRLIQKYEFLVKDLANTQDPSEEQLRSYYAINKDTYYSEKRLSFYHFYFSPDSPGIPEERAEKALKMWGKEDFDGLKKLKSGDFIHISSPLIMQSEELLMSQFGQSISKAMMQATELGWYGPVQSGMGWHVVYITEIIPSVILTFDEARDQVVRDWRSDQMNHYNSTITTSIRSSYEIIYDLDKWKNLQL